MNVQQLCVPPPQDLARALARFEEQFTYPLGPGRSFRISHPDDYARFFRAMGEAACFIAERQGEVLGTLGASLRRLVLPNGEQRAAIYVGDLKIAPAARGGRVLMRLAEAVQQWAASRANVAFSVVMDGTPATPLRYTGRLGIPPFQELAKTVVLRIPAASALDGDDLTADDARGSACYLRLSVGRHACPGGAPTERSEMSPLWLMTPDARACGRLEDTRRAKRLIADDGVEMKSAHLSCFAFADPRAGVALLRSALRRAAASGFPALFVAIAPDDVEAIRSGLDGIDIVAAPATIYGAGLEPQQLWNINTAEI